MEPGQPCVRSSGIASACSRARVDEVDRLPVDRGAEVLELVEPRLVRPPVVVVAPVLDELAQVVDRDPVLPARVLDLVREPRRARRTRRSSRTVSSTAIRNGSTASFIRSSASGAP